MLMPMVPTRRKNRRTVQEALLENNWLLDIRGNLSDEQTRQCIGLWIALEGVERDHLHPDKFIWIEARSGAY
jgi:hypothetical protein